MPRKIKCNFCLVQKLRLNQTYSTYFSIITSTMRFLLAIMILLTISGTKGCHPSSEFQIIETEEDDIKKLEVEVEHLENEIDGLKMNNEVSSDSSTSSDAVTMMEKKDCTQKIIGNRKVACGDLDKISSCTCKKGKQYSKEDKFTDDCKVDFCTCLDNSEVRLFGLHRKLLNCIAI